MEKMEEQRKKSVVDFLKSYLMQKQLEQVSGFEEDEDFNASGEAEKTAPFDTELEVGQIRLLKNTERLTYVVLLSRWTKRSFLVVPFSRFSYPATDGELKTNFDGGLYLKVLQAWNARTLQNVTLQKSWLIGNLPQEDMMEAWNLWRSLSSDSEQNCNTYLERTGLPIYKRNDPRLQYCREEVQNFAVVDAADLQAAERAYYPIPIGIPPVENLEDVARFGAAFLDGVTRAAAGDEKKCIQVSCCVKDLALNILIEFMPQEGVLSLDVYDAEGESSRKLDGCTVVSAADDAVLGTIAEGHMEGRYHLGGENAIRIVNAAGEDIPVVVLKEEGE